MRSEGDLASRRTLEVKAPSSLTDFDPLMPLMLHLNDPLPDPFAPHNLRGHAAQRGSDRGI